MDPSCAQGGSAGITVLVADDDPTARAGVRDLLRAEGYTVLEAADGASALELLAAAADSGEPFPEVLLIDFVMPGLSGLGVLAALRRLRMAPATILMTGFPDRSVEAFAQSAGAVRVLRKPIDADDLLSSVATALRGRSSPMPRPRP